MNLSSSLFCISAAAAFYFTYLKLRDFLDTSKRYNAFLRQAHMVTMIIAFVLACMISWAAYIAYDHEETVVPCTPLPVAVMKYAANDDDERIAHTNNRGERHAPYVRTTSIA